MAEELVARDGSHISLTPLDHSVLEFLNLTAVHADQMVMLDTRVELKNRPVAVEIMPNNDAHLGKLREHPIDRGEANVVTILMESLIHFFGRQMRPLTASQNAQDLQPRQCDLEPCTTQLIRFLANLPGNVRIALGLGYHWRSISCLDGLFRMISVYTGKRLLAVIISTVFIAGCANTVDSLPILFKPEIRQGTLITEETVAQLEPGMSERQVRFVLGPPSIDDPFAEGRWDYVYEVEPRSTDLAPESRRLAVFFENGALAGARGDFISTDNPLYQPADR